jgi:hypothetical protein
LSKNMAEPAEVLRKPKEEKTSEESRRELGAIKGEKKKGWGPGAKAGAIVGSTVAVVSGVAAALGETDNLPDPLQGAYNQFLHPGKVVEEVSNVVVNENLEEKINKEFTKAVEEAKKEEVKETPPIVEEIPAPIEYERVVIPVIEGLRFEEGTFFAEAGNPYGLEEGEKAGVFVKDSVEINGEMEDSIGLKPKVIEVLQKNIYEETKEYLCPLPFNLEKTKGIKITELKYKMIIGDDTIYMGTGWGLNVPVGSVFYATVSCENWCSEWYFPTREAEREKNDKRFYTFFHSDYDIEHYDFSANSQVYVMYFKKVEKTPGLKLRETIRFPSDSDEEFAEDHYEFKLGEDLGVITSEATLDITANKGENKSMVFENSGGYQFYFESYISNINEKFKSVGPLEASEGEEKFKIFILPNESAK